MPDFDVVDRAAALGRRIARLEAELERIESLPRDDFLVGDVLMFERHFTRHGQPYTYCAIKTPAGWYLSGRNHGTALSWEQLLNLLSSDQVDKVWVATEWEEVEL